MFSVLKNFHHHSLNLSPLLLAACLLTLTACSRQDEARNTEIQQDNNLSFQLPDALLGAKVDRNNLSGTVTVAGRTYDLTIDDATDSANLTLPGIPTGSRNFTIRFFYDLGGTILQVAQAERTIFVGEGRNILDLMATDFDTASYDDDRDGISNIDELDESSTSNPLTPLCVLDRAVLDDCELG